MSSNALFDEIAKMSQGVKWQHKTANGKYLVSTSDVIFSGWETMVFGFNADGNINYYELDVDRYSGEDEAYWGHIKMFQKWNEKT
jgi:hypothetical protein